MSITKDFAFEFSWDDQNDPNKYTLSEYRFSITVPDEAAAKILNALSVTDDHVYFVGDDMESYGVHDCSYEPDTEFCGYNSYEIEPKNYDEVMTKWRDYFVSLGYECGPIVRTVHEEKSYDSEE